MDSPIRIMIALFVAVVVAMVVISFANKMINDAKTNINEISPNKLKNQDKDRIIEVTTITNLNVASLAEQCYMESKESFDTEICFVLIGDVQATESGIIDSLFQLNSSKIDIDLSNAKNAVRIKYNVILDKIEIIG
jgi:hypothetical protein